jgi:hypothetical protein
MSVQPRDKARLETLSQITTLNLHGERVGAMQPTGYSKCLGRSKVQATALNVTSFLVVDTQARVKVC